MSEPTTFYGHAMQGYSDGSPGMPGSLQQQSALWSQRASAASMTPRSVLQQVQLAPGNGRSDPDSQRVLPGGQAILPTNNGSSAETTRAQLPLRMAGDLPI
jgi:hypothetical protein